MTTARYTMTGSENAGVAAVEIHADSKKDAQEAIQVARAWIKSAGLPSKLVSFTENTSQYSNLVKYYRARVAFKVSA